MTGVSNGITPITGETMVRRFGLFLFAIGATMSIATMSAQAQTALTGHVRDAV
jgi:hypothetical protein